MAVVLVEMITNMLVAHIPCTLLYDVLLSVPVLRNELLAKATPKVVVTFTAEVHCFAVLLNFRRVRNQIVSALEMRNEGLLLINQLAAYVTTSHLDFASPHLLEEVLGILMSFPVVSAPKTLGAIWEGASVRPSVTLQVFPQITFALLQLRAVIAGIFSAIGPVGTECVLVVHRWS